MNTNGSKPWYQSLWYWRLAIFECLSDAYIAMAMVWMAAVANDEWSHLTSTAKAVIYVSASVAGIKVVKSFLSTTIAVLKDAMPLPTGVASHQEVKETTKTVVDTPPPASVSSTTEVKTP